MVLILPEWILRAPIRNSKKKRRTKEIARVCHASEQRTGSNAQPFMISLFFFPLPITFLTSNTEENEIRQRFVTNFGQYLPSSLCTLPPDATKLRIIEKHEPAMPQLSKQYKRQEQEEIEHMIFTPTSETHSKDLLKNY